MREGKRKNREPLRSGRNGKPCRFAALPTTLLSVCIYIPPAAVPNNFFRLPVADPKLAPTSFFSYVRSLPSLTIGTPLEAEAVVVVVVGILIGGLATNSYGVPARLSSLLVLAVGVWLSEGVARLVVRAWPKVGRRLEVKESLERWNLLR